MKNFFFLFFTIWQFLLLPGDSESNVQTLIHFRRLFWSMHVGDLFYSHCNSRAELFAPTQAQALPWWPLQVMSLLNTNEKRKTGLPLCLIKGLDDKKFKLLDEVWCLPRLGTSIPTMTLVGRHVPDFFMCTCSFSPLSSIPWTSVPAFTVLWQWPLFLQANS